MPRPVKNNARPGRSLSDAGPGAGPGGRPGAEASSGVHSGEWNCDWIPSLAEPYLRGYAPRLESGNSLLGYRFLARSSAAPPALRKKARQRTAETASAGFFVGYLLDTRGLAFLKATPPEFLVFAFVDPLGGRWHRRIVSEPDSLMRRTAEYIRWLTHHPPRFELFAEERTALVRHISTQEWPAGRIEHYARNFSIETLAWLVRSALVRRLPEEIAAAFQSRGPSALESRAARK
jgi:hypothetical protein